MLQRFIVGCCREGQKGTSTYRQAVNGTLWSWDGESHPLINGQHSDLLAEERRGDVQLAGDPSSSEQAALLISAQPSVLCGNRRLPSQPSEKPLCIILPYKETKALEALTLWGSVQLAFDTIRGSRSFAPLNPHTLFC